MSGLEIIQLERPFFLFHPGVCKGVDFVHAHTGQATRVAALGNLVFGTPYIVTRRVDNPIRNNFFNRLAFRRACREQDFRQGLGRAGKQRASQFSLERMANRYIEHCKPLLKN